MQDRRAKKTMKGTQITFMREARRLERLQWFKLAKVAVGRVPSDSVEQYEQSRLILNLAWKTVSLMQKNTIIQQKIVDLQKETSEFITAMMNNRDNQHKYLGFIQLDSLTPKTEPLEEPFKFEPKD